MKRSIVAVLGLSLFLMAGNAHAVLFQFYTNGAVTCPNAPDTAGCSGSDVDSLADGDMDGILSFTESGITVSATSATDDSHLYADYQPSEGGLGALLTGLAEDPITNPDNVEAGQSLIFDFGQIVTMMSVVHFNADHLSLFDDIADYELIIDGGTPIEIVAADMVLLAGATGQVFEFRALQEAEGFYVSAFNVQAAIPEPGTAMLLGMGFVGLGAVRRRAA